MPAVIYAPPDEIGDVPWIDFSERNEKSIDEMLEPEREWENKLKDWARENGSGELRGEEWSYPRGDGYARYVVFSEHPLALVHIPTGDGWQIDEITRRGLRLSDVREGVARNKKIAELFGKKP
jgi:hypothetical protein